MKWWAWLWCSESASQARFSAGPRALFFSRFQSEKKGLSRVKKRNAFSLCHGDVVVKVVVLKA